MRERTCVLIKPDGLQKKVVGQVIDRFEREGFELTALKLVPPDRSAIEAFYADHKGRDFYDGLIKFMMEGPMVASVWDGENAVARTRALIGATNSKEAAPGTLRRLYGTNNRRNLVHASDSAGSAEKEIALLFNKEEIARNAVKI